MFNTRFFKRLAWFGYFGLLLFVPLWHFVLAKDTGNSAAFLFLLWVVPLLLPLRGIIADRPYTYAWANFIVMFYLMHSLTAIYAVSDEWVYGLIEFILATCMFIGCSFYARYRGRELGNGLTKLKDEMAAEKARFEKHSGAE